MPLLILYNIIYLLGRIFELQKIFPETVFFQLIVELQIKENVTENSEYSSDSVVENSNKRHDSAINCTKVQNNALNVYMR